MSRGGPATERLLPGRYALSVGLTDMSTPNGWAWVKLTDVARLESGHTPSRSHPEYWDGDIAWIGIRDARANHGKTIGTTFQTVTQAGIDNSAARLLPVGTVCLSRTASVGYVTVMGRPMATSQDFVNWVCSKAIEPDFLKYLLVAEGEHLRSFGEGSTHTTIYFPEVQAFHVCLPNVPQQRRIAAKLDDLLARSARAKAALDAVPPLLEKLRQSILAAAFRGDLTADWRAKHPEAEPAEKLLARIRIERRRKWEEAELAKMKGKGRVPGDGRWKEKYREPEGVDAEGLPELPVGWCWASLDDLTCAMTSGSRGWSQHYGRGTGTFVMAQNVRPWSPDFSERQAVDPPLNDAERTRTLVEEGDLLITIVGANTGDVCLVTQPLHEHYVCQSVALLRPAAPLTAWHLLAYLNARAGGGGQLEKFAYGQGRPHLGFEHLRAVAVPLPGSDELEELRRRLEDSLAGIAPQGARLAAFGERLSALDSAVLAKAFRGELVPQDPSDEPAEVMVAKLRSSADEPARPRRKRTA